LRGREGEVDLFEGAYEEEKTKGERERDTLRANKQTNVESTKNIK